MAESSPPSLSLSDFRSNGYATEECVSFLLIECKYSHDREETANPFAGLGIFSFADLQLSEIQ